MDYISYWDNVLTKEQCDNIIRRFEEAKDQQKDTLLEGHRHFTEINITDHLESWGDIQNLLLDKMQIYLAKYKSIFGIHDKVWPDNLGFEHFRMKKYEPNGKDEFAFHVDVGDYASARRFLVFFWYLNDVAEGGETTFQHSPTARIEMSVKPVAGRMIAFPPMWTHPHTGHKPISGPKYIIGGYLHYL
jgi:hypothetical protein